MNTVLCRWSAAPFGLVPALIVASGWLPVFAAQQAAGTPSEASAKSEAVAKVAGEVITMAELEEAASAQLKQLDRQRHQLLEQTLTQLVERKLGELEAAARGITTEQLMQAEVQGKFAEVSDEQVDTFYEENKERIRQPKEQIAAQIRQYLQQQQTGQLHGDLMKRLRDKFSVSVQFDPMRAEVSAAGAPAIGPADAPVQLVLFSDFECPYCSRVVPTLDQVQEKYGDRVRLAFRQFPLSIHPHAQKAAEASLCAGEQGKFWEMHDAMFGDQKKLGVDDLKATAATLELKAEQFNSCLDSGKYADQVKKDMESGQEAGVSGTPAMFVNGRFISGAVPYEQLASVIDDELTRKGASSPPPTE